MEASTKTEVVILGAGPSGAITALFLAKSGIHSIVVDKETFPRHKACGDNITGNALRVLNELDASFIPRMSLEKIATPMTGLRSYAPNNHYIDIDFLTLEKDSSANSCYSISRADFDNFLIDRLKENPLITVLENYTVKSIDRAAHSIKIVPSHTANAIIEAKILACCIGSNSSISQALLPQNMSSTEVAIGVRAYFEGVEDCSKPGYCELAIVPELMPGGIYLTPLSNSRMNVNVVMRSDVAKKHKMDLKAAMHAILKEHPILKDRFKNARIVGEIAGSRLNLGVKKRKISGDRFVLVGDAAGLIDLLSANGIPQAMLSAKIAAEEIAGAIAANDFSAKKLSVYDKRVHERTKNYLKLGRIVSPIIGNKLVLKMVVIALNYMAKKSTTNSELRELIYTNEASKKLISPTFYYRLFFGIKNAEHIA